MPRLLKLQSAAALTLALVFYSAPLDAAIFPEQLGKVLRGPVHPAVAPDPQLFEEFGYVTGERADYGDMTVVAWRFKDSTGAFAAFQSLRPDGSKPSKLDKVAATAEHATFAIHGNYLLQFVDGVPSNVEYAGLINRLPSLESGPLPPITAYLPPLGLIPNSERYVLGPASLSKVAPGIPPSVAAFHLSTEGQYARYQMDSGQLNLLIFNYPTPGIARERADAFQKVPGTVVKRTGALVAVTMDPPNPDAAEKLLAKVNYQAQLTLTDKPAPNLAQDTAKMILAILELAGIIMGFCILSGVAFGGFRILLRRLGKEEAGESMITLDLQGK